MIIPSDADLLEVHIAVQEAYPEVPGGMSDTGKLGSIAARPFQDIYGQSKYDTIYRQAACLLEGIIRFHPYPDGNKRTALLAASLFLQANGRRLHIGMDAVDFVVGVAKSGAITEDEIDGLISGIADWLAKRCEP